jgi:hypothetical protein
MHAWDAVSDSVSPFTSLVGDARWHRVEPAKAAQAAGILALSCH